MYSNSSLDSRRDRGPQNYYSEPQLPPRGSSFKRGRTHAPRVISPSWVRKTLITLVILNIAILLIVAVVLGIVFHKAYQIEDQMIYLTQELAEIREEIQFEIDANLKVLIQTTSLDLPQRIQEMTRSLLTAFQRIVIYADSNCTAKIK
ncbi:TPA_asm: hypothetical protein [Raton olivaceo morbillivirus]|uniref:Uncharacterized protein n=1 Tax=Raton olivaceo morbillivirus TaxID=2928189 RepID=A0A9N6YJH9_9MONO|nr:TPA_asm: hypothetical protein [Raton olivaceo morbillivirus]